jgi:general secretion pathway protein I
VIKGLLGQDSHGGFTLLEVVIAMAIMTIAFASILAVEGGSINASARAKQMNIVSMLAKNQMVETEFKIQGKKFEEVRKEESGQFPPPYEDYRWKSVIKEIKFPNLAPSASKTGSTSGSGTSSGAVGSGGQTEMESTIAKTMTTYLSKSIREVTVSIIWNRSGKDQSYSLATYWVDLNHEFNPNEQ